MKEKEMTIIGKMRRRLRSGFDHAVANDPSGIAGRRRGSSRGLTLVEMMVVIALIGVLTAAIAIGVVQAQKRANIGAAKTACNTVRDATIQWRAIHPGED